MEGGVSWRRVALVSALAWVATRAVYAVFTPLAMAFELPNTSLSPLELALRWMQWDGRWYVTLARQGYGPEPIVGPLYCPCVARAAAAFFPLYPLLVHAGSFFLGAEGVAVVAMLVSNLAALAGFVGVGLLAAHERGDAGAALPAILVMAAYPLSFFSFAPFTEGLFLAFAAFALYAARRGLWWWAGAAAFGAALTRPTAVALVLPLLWEFVRQRYLPSTGARPGGRPFRKRSRDLLGAAALASAVPLALGLFFGYLWLVFHDPLAYAHAQRDFHLKVSAAIPETIGVLFANFLGTTPEWRAMILVDFLPLVAFTGLTLVEVRRAPLGFTLYTLGLVYLVVGVPDAQFFGGDILSSGGRYMGAAIPAFLILGRWIERWTWLAPLVVGGGFLLQGALLMRFLAGAWVG
jgi:hypothetical protein